MSKPLIAIVGMGRGISFSVAEHFGKNGFRVAMIARKKESLIEFENQLTHLNIEAKGYAADVKDFDSLRTAFDQIKSQMGDAEVLVYNVSAYREAHPTELNVEHLIEDFKSNVAGALVAVQQVAEAMKKNNRGTIFLTGGGTALHAPSLLSSLGIGKAGLRNLAHSLNRELKSSGVHVSTVTINGAVQKGTRYDPGKIAETFWGIYSANESERKWEVMFD